MTRCPFFEEVLVAFCRAYPVKKMVPSDRLQASSACTCESFPDCPMFKEVMGRLNPGGAQDAEAGPENPTRL